MCNQKKSKRADIIVGLNIKTMRKARGLTAVELAKAIGVTHQQVQKYEKAVNRVTVGRLVDIAETLRVTTDFLLSSKIHQGGGEASRAAVEFMACYAKLDNSSQLHIKHLVQHMAIMEA